ncbi:MAG: DNA-directed RNA polymerase subunit D [Candidatus Aenigmatarchaeota archaeon]
MKIHVQKKSKEKMTFVLEESNPAFANALRRYMMTGVSTMAIKEVYFEKNNSGLFDEIIAHRLGLIPLTFDEKVFKQRDKCKCKDGCSHCQVTLVLDKTGPCIVHGEDMKSTDGSVKPAAAGVPIIELLEGQQIKFEATAELGCGSSHAKHQAAVVGYKYNPKVSLTDEGEPEEAMSMCPKNVFSKRDGKIVVTNNDRCNMCMKCVASGATKVSGDDSKFLFTAESISGKPIEYVLMAALDGMKADAKEFEKELKKSVK